MSNNGYLLRCRDTGDQVLIDAADEPRRCCRSIGDARAHRRRHHPPALGPPPRARRGRRRDRRRRWSPARPTPTRSPSRPASRSPARSATATPSRSALRPRGHPARRAHARLDRAALRRPATATRTCSPATRSSPAASGNTFGDAAAFAQLIDDVETKLFGRLPDETWFYPGHGNDSTLGAERPHLAEWRERGW